MALLSRNVWIAVAVLVVAAIALAWVFSSPSTTPQAPTDQAQDTVAPGSTQTPPTETSSGAKVPTTGSTKTTPTPAATGATITYTSKGFSPAYLEIKAGKAVTFINKSGTSMRVVSTQVPLNEGLPNPGFDQGNTVGLGGTFIFNLSIAGEWHYKSFYRPDFTGVIVVTPQ